MYVLQISIEGLAAWLESKFRAENAPFVPAQQVLNPATTKVLANLRFLLIEDEGFKVCLLELNFLLDIRTEGLQQWLKHCEVFYTNYFVEGRRVLEFRMEIDNEDIVVGYAVDNQLALIAERVAR